MSKRVRLSVPPILILATCVLAAGSSAWLFWHTKIAPHRESADVEHVLRSLTERRPPTMTPPEWESAVAWTLNLHGNSLLSFQADAATIRSFRDELEAKLAEPVNMATIHWIWDSYAGLCRGGKNYQRFRTQMDDEIANGGGDWGLNTK